MALDCKLAARGAWRVSFPNEDDPAWVAARLTLELESGEVTVRLAHEEINMLTELLADVRRAGG